MYGKRRGGKKYPTENLRFSQPQRLATLPLTQVSLDKLFISSLIALSPYLGLSR
jgi:hypothetical protein